MIEAWFRLSLTMRSVSPVMVGMTPGVRREAGLERQDRRCALELGQLRLERLVHGHRAGDRAHRPRPDAEVAHGGEGRLAQPRVVGQAQVVVGREADQPAFVDRHDGTLAAAHHPQGAVQVALTQGRDLVVQEGERVREERRRERIGLVGRHGRLCSPTQAVQSMITFPDSPVRATENAASCSRNPKRCVIAGVMSSPDWSITVILYQVSYISRP